MRLLLLMALIFAKFAYAEGQGRNGGWPSSINLLSLSKSHLIEALEMSKNEELSSVLDLVRTLKQPDVIEIESSNYSGTEMFILSNSTEGKAIEATKAFYNNPEFSLEDYSASLFLIKKVERLLLKFILNEVSTQSLNSIETEIKLDRIMDDLHGTYHKVYSSSEKLNLSSIALYSLNKDKFLTLNRKWLCREVGSDESYELNLNLFAPFSKETNLVVAREESKISLGGLLPQGYLLIEKSEIVSSSSENLSVFLRDQGIMAQIKSIVVCHEDSNQISKFDAKILNQFYSIYPLNENYNDFSPTAFKKFLFQKLDLTMEGMQYSLKELRDSKKNEALIELGKVSEVLKDLKIVHGKMLSHVRKIQFSSYLDNLEEQFSIVQETIATGLKTVSNVECNFRNKHRRNSCLESLEKAQDIQRNETWLRLSLDLRAFKQSMKHTIESFQD